MTLEPKWGTIKGQVREGIAISHLMFEFCQTCVLSHRQDYAILSSFVCMTTTTTKPLL